MYNALHFFLCFLGPFRWRLCRCPQRCPWATDPGPYTSFRDMVLAQTNKVLLNMRRLPMNTVEDGDNRDDDADSAKTKLDGLLNLLSGDPNIELSEEMIGAIQKFTGRTDH